MEARASKCLPGEPPHPILRHWGCKKNEGRRNKDSLACSCLTNGGLSTLNSVFLAASYIFKDILCLARVTMASLQDTVSDKALRVVDGAIYVAKAAPLGTVVKASQATQFSLHGAIGGISASDFSSKPCASSPTPFKISFVEYLHGTK